MKEIGDSRETRTQHFGITFILRCVVLSMLCLSGASERILAQSNSAGSETVPFCDRSNAIDSIRQQIELAKTIDEPMRRIAVLLRAADILWPIDQRQAREVFTGAFDLAVESENGKEKDIENVWRVNHSVLVLMQSPDLRYVVIRAVAKRDSAWAKKLTDQVIRQDRERPANPTSRDFPKELLIANRLLESAIRLLPGDIDTALNLARASLDYPANSETIRFLYKLAETNQVAADQFYEQALPVYQDKPLREFLYLATYPFAFRSSGDTPVFGFYQVPENFVVNNSLQRRFILTLLRRAQNATEVPLDASDDFHGLSGTAHILQVLIRLEPVIRERMPELMDAVVQAREKIFVSIAPEMQAKLIPEGRAEAPSRPPKSLADELEEARKTPNVNARDDRLAEAILSSSVKESVDTLLGAADDINDSSIRNALIEWLYFRHALEAAHRKQFDEAERLTIKIEGFEVRSFLHTEIAKGMVNIPETQMRGREILEMAIKEANKAGRTIFASRALLTASSVYTKIDLGRSLSLLSDAIDCINHIDDPDFDANDQTLVKQVNRKNNPGGRFIMRFYMPGLSPETAFRELAKIDFNDALAQTSALRDKYQRAMTSLTVADVCLQEAERRRGKNPKKIANR